MSDTKDKNGTDAPEEQPKKGDAPPKKSKGGSDAETASVEAAGKAEAPPDIPDESDAAAGDPAAESDGTVTREELQALAEVLQEGNPIPETTTGIVGEDVVVLRYDIIGASTQTRRSLPVLDLVHDRYQRMLSSELERATRVTGEAVLEPPITRKFAEVYSTLETPCAALIIDAIGLDARGMLLLDPAFLIHFLDLFIGGPGGAKGAIEMIKDRGYSPAEKTVCAHFTTVVGRAIQLAWAEIADIHIELVRIESDPRHAVIMEPGDSIIEFPVRLSWGEMEGTLRLVLPLTCIRPLEARLSSTVADPAREMTNPWRASLLHHISMMNVEAVVELGRAEVTLDRLVSMQIGDVVRLDRGPEGALEVQIAGVIKYEARPVVHRGNMAAQITEIVGSPDLPEDPHTDPENPSR